MAEGGEAEVKTRHVFYLHGYDPRSPAAYHRLYREQAARQGALTGVEIEVGPRERNGDESARWPVTYRADGGEVHTVHEVLRWDDMVRSHWPRGTWHLLGRAGRYLVAYCRAGFMGRLRRAARPAFLAILFPVAVPALYFIIGLLIIAALLAAGSAMGLGGGVLALTGGGLLTLIALGWGAVDRWLNLSWLTRVFSFLLDWSEGRVAGLAQRHDRFADAIAAALAREDLDEVLVVGHSVGAHHAMAVMARLRRRGVIEAAGDRLRLMTLGQSIALLNALPGAADFRRDVEDVVTAPGLVWVDITSPSDPASSCAVDPLVGTSVARPAGPVLPAQVSPRFHLLLEPESFRRIRRDPFAFHFQYLMAAERQGPYDFFDLVAGPRRLAAPDAPLTWTIESNADDRSWLKI